ncbi:GID4/VID24 family protein [Aspergillus chevalieri]|uniref:Vacuolar import and degradation protein-domain-containing protein n=1 Tax=Aspergillus chevalieri TaxID=182096 RepID=A0A7R7ZK10_ASPCH|nr:uncharacterized protein ACHE_11496S [Aspergillus chevalieri]BCR84094.1 hypothetical protein ACHE_11496S [Aspergillus chevalieri]
MPPANSPSQDTPALSPAAPASSSLSFQQSSSVPIPISTLPTPAIDNDAHDDNVSFLRSRVRSSPDSSSSLSRQRRRRQQQQHNISEFDPDPMDVDGPRTSSEFSRRIPIVRRQRDESNHMPNYEGRSTNVRSLYGWAPGSEEDEQNDEPAYDPLPEGFSSWFGRLSDRQPGHRHHARERERERDSVVARTFAEGVAEGDRHRIDPSTSMAEALLQSVRRQPRFSRTRTLQNYLLDRERADRDAEESRERQGPTPRAYRFLPTSRETHRILTHNDLRARISAHRQMHLDNPPSPRLTETIKYLERLRDSSSLEESVTSAAGGGFTQWALDDDDFILDIGSIHPPPHCSWLRPGMVFSGSQKAAATGPGTLLPQRISSPPQSSANDPIIVNGSSENSGRINVYTTSGRRYLANTVYGLGNSRDENWPVRVTIHDINHEDMTLSGTMEAYNIPDKTSPSQDAHIVTFLEGEIIDFNKHTLETKNFKADAEIDSTYWRELQPFKNLTDEEMTRNLVSRKWITEELSKGWILMRWKERCFITPTDSRQGLTIFGFYYISLCRETGHIEGLYYDPGSSPYQQLSLKPEDTKMVFPSYQFR